MEIPIWNSVSSRASSTRRPRSAAQQTRPGAAAGALAGQGLWAFVVQRQAVRYHNAGGVEGRAEVRWDSAGVLARWLGQKQGLQPPVDVPRQSCSHPSCHLYLPCGMLDAACVPSSHKLYISAFSGRGRAWSRCSQTTPPLLLLPPCPATRPSGGCLASRCCSSCLVYLQPAHHSIHPLPLPLRSVPSFSLAGGCWACWCCSPCPPLCWTATRSC